MHELLAQVETHLRMAWRFRWVALVVSLVVCLVGWTQVLLLPDRYTAQAKVYIDTSTMLLPAIKGIALDPSVRFNTIDMIRKTLLTRPSLERIARAADLDLQAQTPQAMDGIVGMLGAGIKLIGTPRDSIFTVAFSSQDPQKATRIVEATMNEFVERALGETRKDSTETREFLTQQIREHEQRMLAAEQRVNDFKRANLGLSSGEGYFNTQQNVRAQIEETKLQLQETEKRRDELSRQLKEMNRWFDADDPAVRAKLSHPLDSRIASLQANLDQMLMRYTERHPDVLSTQRLIDSLTKQREEDLLRATGQGRDRVENPMYQQMTIALGKAEGELAGLKGRLGELQARERDLSALVDRALQVEMEQKALNRDYSQIKSNYSQLVARVESLDIADAAAKSSGAFKFQILEPPRLPRHPSYPNRPLMNAGVLGAGFVAGAALAWLLGFLRPAVYGREGFQQFTDLPILGTVSRVMSLPQRRQHWVRLGLFFGGLASVVLGYWLVVALEPRAIETAVKVQSAVTRFL